MAAESTIRQKGYLPPTKVMFMPPQSSHKRELPSWIQDYVPKEERDGWDELPEAQAVGSRDRSEAVQDPAASVRKLRKAEGRSRLSSLKLFALTFLLPGLAGLIFSAMVSTSYREKMPRKPVPAMQRTIPRNVHGVTVYQTAKEDTQLSAMEYGSVSVFLVGLLFGILYLEKWSAARQQELETNVLGEGEYEM